MASAFTHAAVGLAIGTAFRRPGPPAGFWLAGAACAALPDLDAIGFRLGVPYGNPLGHRGLTHSLFFAALVAAVGAALLRRVAEPDSSARLWTYLFLATASHGALDAMTSGGLGVAFFAPFDNTRYFFPWRPIPVSPLSVRAFFSARGLAIIRGEIVWVWMPSMAFVLTGYLVRAARRPVIVKPATTNTDRAAG